MKIKVAKHVGFCFGVRRAVNIAQDALKKNGRLFCFGQLIHNPQEVKRLTREGLIIIDSAEDLKKGSLLIIRSHGLLPGMIKTVRGRGVRLIDATCPFVKKAQNICRMLTREGFDVVVVGDKRHPEVKALVGFANSKAAVVENIKDVQRLKLANRNIGVLAQTTQSRRNFQDVISALLKRCDEKFGFQQLRIFNTICGDSATRQAEARDISVSCDAMLVIGGQNSANSRRLANICRGKVCVTHHIETTDDIKPSWFKSAGCIGVVSGASTPDWIINDVIKKLKTQQNKTSAKIHR